MSKFKINRVVFEGFAFIIMVALSEVMLLLIPKNIAYSEMLLGFSFIFILLSVDILSYLRMIYVDYFVGANGRIVQVLLLIPAEWCILYWWWEVSLIFFFFVGLIEYEYVKLLRVESNGGEHKELF